MITESSNFYEVFYDAIKSVKAESAKLFKQYILHTEINDLELVLLGLESIDMFELVGKLEDEYKISIGDHEVFAVKTIGEVKSLVECHLGR
jgi:acyl carrier protein